MTFDQAIIKIYNLNIRLAILKSLQQYFRMSKQNKLLASIQTDIKIEKGLKILQFATEYYLTRSYLRSTPLNYNINKRTTLKQQEDYAEVIAELNKQIIQPKPTQLKTSIDQIKLSPSKIREKQLLKTPTNTKILTSQRMQDKFPITRIQSPDSSFQLPQNSKVVKKIQQKPSKVQSKIKKSKVEQIPPSQKKGKKVEFVEVSKSNNSSSISQQFSEDLKSQSINSSKELSSQDFLSYHSESSRSMKVIQEVSESDQNSSYLQQLKQKGNKIRKQNAAEGYSIEQFNSINQGKISIGNSTIIVNKVEPTKKVAEKSLQTSNIILNQTLKKSEKLSFLDRSITQIQQSDSKSFILGSELNQTQKSLLKQISDSFVENQKIKTLIKLQNLELQEKHLLQRMEKRFQGCADQINQIRSINWESLNLPQANISFKRPNYAHCIE